MLRCGTHPYCPTIPSMRQLRVCVFEHVCVSKMVPVSAMVGNDSGDTL